MSSYVAAVYGTGIVIVAVNCMVSSPQAKYMLITAVFGNANVSPANDLFFCNPRSEMTEVANDTRVHDTEEPLLAR